MAELRDLHDDVPTQSNGASSSSSLTFPPSSPQQPVKSSLTTSTLKKLTGEHEDDRMPVSPIMSRRTSFESDRFSTVSGLTSYFPNSPKNVNPAPVYVAPSGALQVVCEHLSLPKRESSEDEDDGEKQLNKDEVVFNEASLALVNAFLDQLLYSFLSTARSTSLLVLRPAVGDVLKQRLAKDAIASAEQELAELMGGGEDEEDDDNDAKLESNQRWDLELVWKRTRLRVMVYCRLGEMEDADEERYVKEEGLFSGDERRFSRSSGLVSWAVAIFLTGVLEYIGEQILQTAGQAAYTRARRESRTQRSLSAVPPHKAEPLKVDEFDVEKVALHSTLGRLWRTWRKALRNNTAPSSPTQRTSTSHNRGNRENMVSAMSHRRSSFGTAQENSIANDSRPASRDQKEELGDIEHPEHVLASNIALPMGDPTKDIDEITIAGLMPDPEDDDAFAARDDEPYPHDVLGSLVALPLLNEDRDVDEIELPGLAKDPDAPEAHQVAFGPPPRTATRRYSAGDFWPNRKIAYSDAASDAEDRPVKAVSSDANRQRAMSLPHPESVPSPLGAAIVGVPTASKDADSEGVQDNGVAEEGADDEIEKQGDDGAEKSATQPMSSVVDGDQGTGFQTDAPKDGHDQHESTQNELATGKRDSEFPWMAAGAGVATVAGVTAAGVWASQSKDESQHPPADGMNDTTSEQRDVEPSGPSSSLTTDAAENAMRQPGAGSWESSTDKDTFPTQRSFSDEEIAELDRRKSLIDIKAMMIVNGPSGPTSPENEEPPFQTGNPVADEYQIDSGDTPNGVSEQEGPGDAIGVARTSDVPLVEQQAREPHGPAPLVISTASRDQEQDSPTIVQTPRTMQRQFLDLTADANQTDTAVRPRSSHRVSLANGAQQSAALESPPHRGSLTVAVEKEAVSHDRKRSSVKSTESKSPKTAKSPRLVSNPDAMKALTSASIRGPEDFDMFVQGAGTAKYTLTPDAVRDEPATPSHWQQQAPVEMDATSISTATESRDGRSVTSKQVTSAPAPAPSVAGAESKTSKASKRRSVSKPTPRNVSSHSKSGWMAREPRVQTESTRDFADFIRSTGPQKDATVVPLLSNASQNSLHTLRSAHIYGASASRSSSPNGADRTKSLTQSLPGGSVPPVPRLPTKSKSRTNLQPRGAKATTDGSADLIDFIRSGPDEDGKRRISRSVAPFRTTMDSDQFRDLSDRNSGDRLSDARGYTNSTQSVRSSQRTSVNSRSALLTNGPSTANRTAPPAYNSMTPALNKAYGIPEPTHIDEPKPVARKRVRNKDPYNMDFLDDDEDDENLADSLGRPDRNEESLVDFLNNTEPPKSNLSQPIVDPNSPAAISALNRMRTGSMGKQKPPAPAVESYLRSKANGSSVRPGFASPVRTPSRMQARGGQKDIAANSNTAELADFLKNSGPEDPNSAPAPMIGRGASRPSTRDEKPKKKGSFGGGFFSRGSKRKTYLDMP